MTRRALRLAGAFVVALAMVGCGSTAPSAAPSGDGPTAAAPTTATEATEPAAEPTSVATAAPAEGQTETEWGRIWDTPPAGFPVFPGATPSEEAATGPATAVYAVEGSEPDQIATWYQRSLRAWGVPHRLALRTIRGRRLHHRIVGGRSGVSPVAHDRAARPHGGAHPPLRGRLPAS